MAFRQGDENEALLVCRRCKGAFQMEAQFCGFCGAPRPIALGIERDPTQPPPPPPPPPPHDEPIQFEEPEVVPAKSGNRNRIMIGLSALLIAAAAVVFALPHSSTSTSTSNQASDTSSPSPTSKASSSPKQKPSKSPTKKSTSTKPSTAVVPKDSGNCVINDGTVSDLVDYKNAIDNIPTGSNDGANKVIILQWASSANGTAESVSSDSSSSKGKVRQLLTNAASDLSSLSDLANQWANKDYSDPQNFSDDYAAAVAAVRSDYRAISSTCGDKVPGA